jgi:methyl-accepting chemotaxis protein
MRPRKSQLRTTLGLSFVLAMWLPVAVEVLGVEKLSASREHFKQLAVQQVPAIVAAAAWAASLQDATLMMGDILLVEDAKDTQARLAAIQADRMKSQQALDALNTSTESSQSQASLQGVLSARADYLPSEESFLELIDKGNRAAAQQVLIETVRPAQINTIQALDRFILSERSALTAATQASLQQYRSDRNTLIVSGVLVFLIGSLAASFAINNIRNGLGGDADYAAAIASRIASGEFSVEIHASYGDRSSLLATMESMRDNLSKIVCHVRQAAASVCQGTTKLSRGNSELSQRTQEQAHALAATSANIEELTVSVKQNADNARQTTRRVIEVCKQAENGGAVVQRAVAAMAEISASSRKISDIIGVIDEIAFQTNLLALNAAVEAARAGEQGRGFAVVASEVRSLAQRSATAAKQIKTLITESVDKVDVGSELIGESGETLAQIIQGVKKVADVIADIAAASEEQAAGIDEVNVSVARMDSTTQQNSSLVSDAAATSTQIQRQAEDLAATVAFFRTGASDSRSFAVEAVKDGVRLEPQRMTA